MNARLSWTLSSYFGGQFLLNFLVVLGGVVTVIFFADVTEMLRRAAENDTATLGVVVTMSALKLPSLSEKALPFIVLFAAMWTFIRLTRNHELVVARASGVSVWQFLAPPIGLALIIGVVTVAAYDPVAAIMAKRYEHLEAKHLEDRPSLLAVSHSGLWLRQADQDGQSVVHALRVGEHEADGLLILENVIVFLYQGANQFRGRIDAESAVLREGSWKLHDVWLTGPRQPTLHRDAYFLPTSLTPGRVQESFASPETLSFWDLPNFIRTLEQAGFSAVGHRLHWHSVLSLPLLLSAMVLIAASFALRGTQRGTIRFAVLGAVLAGFLVYFMSDLALALGQAGSLPPVLAAWTPAGASALLGATMLLHLEDG